MPKPGFRYKVGRMAKTLTTETIPGGQVSPLEAPEEVELFIRKVAQLSEAQAPAR